jgi:hypothetical protein
MAVALRGRNKFLLHTRGGYQRRISIRRETAR